MKAFLVIIILLLLGIGFFFIRRDKAEEVSNTYATPYTTPAGAPTPTTTTSMVRNINIAPDSIVKSPLTVKGEARGTWYFEASFPIKVLDSNGKVLGTIPAQAQGDWMTTNFVPFRAIVSFATSTTLTGTLLLEKDNPSGLSENAQEVRVPVRFR